MSSGGLSEHEERLFDQIKADLKELQDFDATKPESSKYEHVAAALRGLHEFVTPRRVARVVWAMTFVTLGAVVGYGYEHRNQGADEAAAAQARRQAVLLVLHSPDLRAQLGICDRDLNIEEQDMVLDPSPEITKAQINDALAQPGSAGVPCQPQAPDRTYTTVIDGITINVTPADLLPHSINQLYPPTPGQSPRG